MIATALNFGYLLWRVNAHAITRISERRGTVGFYGGALNKIKNTFVKTLMYMI